MLGTIRVDDPESRYGAVRLCADRPLRDRDFRREDGAWVLPLPKLRLARLEYQLELVESDGSTLVTLDPGNPERAPGAFGEKSVVVAPEYHAPDWLDEEGAPGESNPLSVRVLGRDLEIAVWSPGEGELPLLVAHDGPEYDELADLTRYAAAMIGRGVVPPFRVALLPPGDRDEWYSASPAYGRALGTRLVPALRAHFDVAGPPVGLGTSLGALALLHAQRSWPGVFAGLCLQSGSFFFPRFDRHESGMRRYGRVTRFVRGVIQASPVADAPRVVMTCGIEEENIHNNRVMAAVLAAQAYDVQLHEVADLHNYTAWRDALHPHLTGLLTALWSSQ